MLLKNLDDLDKNGKVGDWCFVGDDESMFIRYGENFEDVCCVKIKGFGAWKWNGNKEAPTLSPSILVSKSETVLWHGFMKNGKLEEV